MYAAPATAASGVRTVRQVGVMRFSFTGTPGPFAPIGQVTATGADFSRDGTMLVVRTYTDAYVWQVHDGRSGGGAAHAPDPGRAAAPIAG